MMQFITFASCSVGQAPSHARRSADLSSEKLGSAGGRSPKPSQPKFRSYPSAEQSAQYSSSPAAGWESAEALLLCHPALKPQPSTAQAALPGVRDPADENVRLDPEEPDRSRRTGECPRVEVERCRGLPRSRPYPELLYERCVRDDPAKDLFDSREFDLCRAGAFPPFFLANASLHLVPCEHEPSSMNFLHATQGLEGNPADASTWRNLQFVLLQLPFWKSRQTCCVPDELPACDRCDPATEGAPPPADPLDRPSGRDPDSPSGAGNALSTLCKNGQFVPR